jgi:hypothetical protein
MIMRYIPEISMGTDLSYNMVEGNVGGVVAGLVDGNVVKILNQKIF